MLGKLKHWLWQCYVNWNTDSDNAMQTEILTLTMLCKLKYWLTMLGKLKHWLWQCYANWNTDCDDLDKAERLTNGSKGIKTLTWIWVCFPCSHENSLDIGMTLFQRWQVLFDLSFVLHQIKVVSEKRRYKPKMLEQATFSNCSDTFFKPKSVLLHLPLPHYSTNLHIV